MNYEFHPEAELELLALITGWREGQGDGASGRASNRRHCFRGNNYALYR